MVRNRQSNTNRLDDKQIEAAMEIVRGVAPLIDLARAARLGFVAYLLGMVSQEATRVAGHAPTDNGSN